MQSASGVSANIPSHITGLETLIETKVVQKSVDAIRDDVDITAFLTRQGKTVPSSADAESRPRLQRNNSYQQQQMRQEK